MRGCVCGAEPAGGSEEVGEEQLLGGLLGGESGGKKAGAGGQTLYPALFSWARSKAALCVPSVTTMCGTGQMPLRNSTYIVDESAGQVGASI